MADDCACLYGGYDDCDGDGFEHTETRTARKPHTCRECGQTIAPGDRYQYFSSKHDGAIFNVKTCAVCAEIREALYCDGYYFGRMWSDIESQLFQKFSVACVDQLTTAAAKTVLQRRYMEWLGV